MDIVLSKGAVDVPGHLRGLPAGKVRKDIGPHLLDASLESGHIGAYVQAVTGQGIQFLNFLFQFHNRFFKFKIKRSSHYDTSLFFTTAIPVYRKNEILTTMKGKGRVKSRNTRCNYPVHPVYPC